MFFFFLLLISVSIISQLKRLEFNIALIILPLTDLYDRLIELAGPEFNFNDFNNEKYFSDYINYIIFRLNELLISNNQTAL